MKIIVCPVALHPDGATRRIAISQHPTEGLQLLKANEPTRQDSAGCAARALYAMSALETHAALPIGTSPDIETSAEWHFALCRIVPPVRERWKHLHAEAGILLHFSWMPLDEEIEGLTPQDLRALDWIRATL